MYDPDAIAKTYYKFIHHRRERESDLEGEDKDSVRVQDFFAVRLGFWETRYFKNGHGWFQR